MLPVSQYEELLAEVKNLRRKAQRVQQLATPLLSLHKTHLDRPATSREDASYSTSCCSLRSTMDSLVLDRPLQTDEYERVAGSDRSEDEGERASTTGLSASSEPLPATCSLYHKTWPGETSMWNSEPGDHRPNPHGNRTEMTSVMSFASSSGGAPLDRVLSSPTETTRTSQQLEAKVDMVYSLLAMLGGQEHADMGETLLALSANPESCLAMRQSGCIPLLVQLAESDRDFESRNRASQALHNLVHSNPDEKTRRREVRVLRLLQQGRGYILLLQGHTDVDTELVPVSDSGDRHPVQTMGHLMKLSFDEGHRQAICQLGGIHTIAKLVESEHTSHGLAEDNQCVLLRRYSCMALTNLTFGDSGNKALLCSCKEFMKALIVQLQSTCDELRQVTASVLRNLSWRADSSSKQTLRHVGAVQGLMRSAMMDSKENTLKSILSALWNLSAHCSENKSDICSVDGALGFLVSMLTYKAPSKSLAIVENAGGILRNVSSQIAIRDDYRQVLRKHDCLQVLLEQLKSPSLTVVSNACGTLWNLSAKNEEDQEALWQMGAPAMLRSLNHSKHKMIAMGSSAALKNLLASRPSHNLLPPMDSTARALDLPVLPTLGARKQKALMQELDQNLSETCDNIDKDSPTKTATDEEQFFMDGKRSQVFRSESQECVPRTDIAFEAHSSRSDPSLRNDIDFSAESTFTKKIAKETFSFLDEKDHCCGSDVEIEDGPRTMEAIIETIQGFPTRTREEFLMDEEANVTAAEVLRNTSSFSLQLSKSQPVVVKPANKSEEEMAISNRGRSMVKSCLPRPTGSGIPLPRSAHGNKQIRNTVPIKPFARSSSTEHKHEATSAKSHALVLEAPNAVTCINTTKPVGVATKQFAIRPQDETHEPEFGCSKMNFAPWENDANKSANNSRAINVDSDQMTKENVDSSSESDHFALEKAVVDNRMLDPDAMIESLDRFTAELVSQAEAAHSNKETQRTNASLTEAGNTWNDTSPDDVTFPTVSGSAPNVLTFEDDRHPAELEQKSNDFSSINTASSSMTQSTLIAVEATKIASVLKIEAEMSQSITSIQSLELDSIQPPSNLNSLTNSVNGLDFPRTCKASPKLPRRKKSLQTGLLARWALTNSSHQASSIESLENNSLSNLDCLEPPSAMGDVIDMQGSITSVASLPNEIILPSKQPLSYVSELENINPPSLFNEITDLCNSLADVPTEGICSETEIFEDCNTHVQTEDDVTLFSDAQSITPSQSDLGSSSAESTPKKTKTINRGMTAKQKRKFAQERYKTYTIAAEMMTSGEKSMSEHFKSDGASSEYETGNDVTITHSNSVAQASDSPAKTTPKERRKNNPQRFQTQVLDQATTLELKRQFSTPDRERFNTRAIGEPSLSPDLSGGSNDFQFLQHEANRVLRKLQEDKVVQQDDFLECETLSLVSNDEDSEQNSGASMNYRTYTKNCGYKGNNLTRIRALVQASMFPGSPERNVPANVRPVVEEDKRSKPKIVKPSETAAEREQEETKEEPKAIRGRRKPLYAKSNVTTRNAPVRNITSNLVKNVTSSLKSRSSSESPNAHGTRAAAGGAKQIFPRTRSAPAPAKPKPTSPKQPAGKTKRGDPATPKLDRQGTFTKDDTPKSRIPTTKPSSRIARAISQTNSSVGRTVTRVQHVVSALGRSSSADGSCKSNLDRNAAAKKSTAAGGAQRSVSNVSISSTNNKKQVTSKIASLWKKVEEQKKQPAKKDSRVWIRSEAEQESPRLIRSNTFEAKDGVILRKQNEAGDPTKRVSRLGSFIIMDDGQTSQSEVAT